MEEQTLIISQVRWKTVSRASKFDQKRAAQTEMVSIGGSGGDQVVISSLVGLAHMENKKSPSPPYYLSSLRGGSTSSNHVAPIKLPY
ncbi:hypothetical protein LSTR_LSTR016060 [Laodelphax striatellus]|uniref:Uncharacterized protein n=1 Tax=Laodelphax striatellus TaxID=195883 RepID=A0A482X073_LAOST|nr:hypothetical protein LSTR_LSTR016060 [Laodelphax striatellus]